MTRAASAGAGQPQTVRVLAVRVQGEQLRLLGEVAEQRPGAPAVPPSELVLRAHGSGEEVRIGLTAGGTDAALSGEIDVRPLLRNGNATWDVRVEDGAGGPVGLDW